MRRRTTGPARCAAPAGSRPLALALAVRTRRPADRRVRRPPTAAAVTSSPSSAFYTPPSPLPPAAPGTLIRSVRVTGVPGRADGRHRVADPLPLDHHLRRRRGRVRATSSRPPAPAPAGGYPVIAWAHGTSGFAAPCAPVALHRLGRRSGPYLLPLARPLPGCRLRRVGRRLPGTRGVRRGPPLPAGRQRGPVGAGRHPGHLRTCRAAAPADAVVIYGHSQGGHAALFAAEMAPTYAPDLHVVGVVAAAPATGLSTLHLHRRDPDRGPVPPLQHPDLVCLDADVHRPARSVGVHPGRRAFASTEVTRGCSDQVAAAITAHHLHPGRGVRGRCGVGSRRRWPTPGPTTRATWPPRSRCWSSRARPTARCPRR